MVYWSDRHGWVLTQDEFNKPMNTYWNLKRKAWGFPWKFVTDEGLIINMAGTKYGKDQGDEPVSCAGRLLLAASASQPVLDPTIGLMQ
jgi:hypothetical protein